MNISVLYLILHIIVLITLGKVICKDTHKTDSSVSVRAIDSNTDDKPLRINLSCKLFFNFNFM